jgi:hypothetical protein
MIRDANSGCRRRWEVAFEAALATANAGRQRR